MLRGMYLKVSQWVFMRRACRTGTPSTAGVYLPRGVAVDTRRYLKGLWHACAALAREEGSACELRQETVSCLYELHSQHADASSIIPCSALPAPRMLAVHSC